MGKRVQSIVGEGREDKKESISRTMSFSILRLKNVFSERQKEKGGQLQP